MADSSTHAGAGTLSPDAFLSLGSMEGIYAPIVTPVLPAHETVPDYCADLTPEASESLGSMEGMAPVVQREMEARRSARAWSTLWPGYALAAGVAAAAYAVHYLPFKPFAVPLAEGSGVRHPISAALLAICGGLILRNTLRLPDATRAGCKHVVRKLIPIAIVLTGAGLDLAQLSAVGPAVLFITVCSVAAAVVGCYYIGRALSMTPRASILLGAGTGICGNSAIIAVSPLVDAEDDDVVLAVGAVNLFGLLAMLAWPALGGLIGLDQAGFGVWAGTSIHAVPQVVAAGYAYGTEAGTLATVVKLVRVTLLAPLVFVLAVWHARRHAHERDGNLEIHYTRLVPWFVWAFAGLAVLSTLGLMPSMNFEPSSLMGGSAWSVQLRAVCTLFGKIALTVAMAAIGLEVSLRTLVAVGRGAVVAGAASTLLLGLVSLGLIHLLL